MTSWKQARPPGSPEPQGSQPGRPWPQWLLPAAGGALAGASALGTAALAGPLTGPALALAAAACAAVAGLCHFGARHTAGSGGPSAAEVDDGTGARLMARHVVPVWRRQIEASRAAAEKGVNGLLESFNTLTSGLATAADAAAAGPGTLGAGAADDLIDNNQQLIDELLLPIAELRRQRDEMHAELSRATEEVSSLGRTAKDMESLSRHARLVAMNASIEANRAGQSQGGFGAVAREVLDLSARTGELANHLLDRFGDTERRLSDLRRRIELDTGNGETLQIELRQRARSVVDTLVGDMSNVLATSRELRETSQQLRDSLEHVFMGFQFQDRLNQMLGSVEIDMDRFENWLVDDGQASHAQASEWLQRLEDSYTMEEQRSHHHGTVEIDRGPGVEFF